MIKLASIFLVATTTLSPRADSTIHGATDNFDLYFLPRHNLYWVWDVKKQRTRVFAGSEVKSFIPLEASATPPKSLTESVK